MRNLGLIGAATGGTAVFVCGMSIAVAKLSFGLEVWANVILKNIAVPALYVGVGFGQQ